ncbi:hypothetical protein HWV62_13040 [Athelia sp. TMB]|nr:hypothetical protein HWV62_13040 [Athelia sp. TMB]
MDASRCEEKSTKAATKGVNTKTKEPKEKKEKRAPTAYNTFTSTHMKALKETNPGKQNSELMKDVAALWRDSPENPRRGQAPRPRKPKAKKTAKDTEETASSSAAEDLSSDPVPSSSSG